MVAGKSKTFTEQHHQMHKQTTPSRNQKTAEIAARKQTPLPLNPPPLPLPSSRTVFSRSFGVYFPRATAQVQPRPPDVRELIKVIEELRDREARLKTEVLELKIRNESVKVLDEMEKEIEKRDFEVGRLKGRVGEVEIENERLRGEVVEMRRRLDEMAAKTTSVVNETAAFSRMNAVGTVSVSRKENVMATSLNEATVLRMNAEEALVSRFQGLIDASVKSTLIRNLKNKKVAELSRSRGDKLMEENVAFDVCQVTKASALPVKTSLPHQTRNNNEVQCAFSAPSRATPPPPPPPPVAAKSKLLAAGVTRVPEVVEFYHWLTRRDLRREPSVTVVHQGSNSRDMIGEIENRSAYSLAIKTDVETKGDFIRMLIKEVKNADFLSIEYVLPFVKWLDEELSLLVDERAVLKHFDWPEQKADALREAAFGYSDLKKLETEASGFRDDPRQSCGSALKKMQELFEKLEHGVYNLSNLRESASKKYKMHRIPLDWILETGLASQIKLASVKLAMNYMKRISAELESVTSGNGSVELTVRGVKFAFRVHQFAGGFDAETMKAFKQMKDKARTCGVQCHSQQ